MAIKNPKEVESPYIFLLPLFFFLILFAWQDKWRNLSVNTAAQGSKDKARNPKIKATAPAPAPVASVQNATSATPVRQIAASDAVVDDPAQKAQDVKHAPRYVFYFLFSCSFLCYASILNDLLYFNVAAIVKFR